MKKSLITGVASAGAFVLLAGGLFALTTVRIPTGSDPKPASTVAAIADYRFLEASPAHPTAPPELVVEAPTPLAEEPAVPSGPDLCPAGTTANSNDGTNDTSCFPDVCFTLRGLPDPAYPECDYAYPPEYYR